MDKDKRILYIASLLALIVGINHFAGTKSTYKFLLLTLASVVLYQFSVYKISFKKPKIMNRKTTGDNYEDGFYKDFGLNPKDFENPSKIIKESPQISGGLDEKVKNNSTGTNKNLFSIEGLC